VSLIFVLLVPLTAPAQGIDAKAVDALVAERGNNRMQSRPQMYFIVDSLCLR